MRAVGLDTADRGKSGLGKRPTVPKEIGRHELAKAIREEIQSYRNGLGNASLNTAAAVYSEIEDVVSELMLGEQTMPEFSAIVSAKARDCGMSVSEFLGNYRRARTVFDKAMKACQAEVDRMKALRARIEKSKRR